MTKRLDIIGHRGARALFPENTLAGFIATAGLGVTVCELDVGMTADGIVVVCHDPALNPDLTRDAGGAWIGRPGPLIRHLTLAELAAFDVGRIKPGSVTAGLFPDQAPHDGAGVPTLAAVLAALPEMRFVVEVKTDPAHPDRTAAPPVLAEAVLAVVDEARAAGRVTIESFDWRVQSHIRRIRPEIRLAWLTAPDYARDSALWWDGVRPADHAHCIPACVVAAGGRTGDAWAPAHRGLTEAEVRRAQALGLGVLPWTVNQPDEIRRLIGWRVDGLISDRPDLVAALMG